MGRVIVTEFVSLDGVMEDPGGAEGYEHGGWVFKFDRGAEGNQFKLSETLDAEAMLLGRVTYHGFAAAWPEREDEAGFADKMNSMPKYVVSSTLTDPVWNNTTVVGGDLNQAVTKLKADVEGDLLVAGSAQLVQGLVAADLIDELRLMVFPVVLRSGKKLFADDGGAPLTLQAAGVQPVGDDGVVILTYSRATPAP
jgi:dihydrofolate reductase